LIGRIRKPRNPVIFVFVLAILVTWVALMALVVGLLKVGTSTPTPQPAPRRPLAPATIQLVGQQRHVA
jgi:hypothetical protein